MCLLIFLVLDSYSLRERAIIREMNETVSFFVKRFLEAGGSGCSESREKVGYSILSTGLASPVLHRLRPPSVTQTYDAALARESAVGGYSSASDDPAP